MAARGVGSGWGMSKLSARKNKSQAIGLAFPFLARIASVFDPQVLEVVDRILDGDDLLRIFV